MNAIAPKRRSLVAKIFFSDSGKPLCSARKKRCAGCQYRFERGDRRLDCPQCGRSRHCSQTVSYPGERCYFHARDSVRGIAHHNFKHGRYSRHMPARLSDRYIEAAHDPELLAIRQDIALLDARASDLLSRADSGESGAIWARAREEFEKWRAAADRGVDAEARQHLAELAESLTKGAGDYAVWVEITDLIEHRRKLVETEMRRLEKMSAFITVEQASMLLASVGEVIKRHVTNPETLQAIARDLSRIMASSSGGRSATDLLPPGSQLAQD